MKGVKYIGQVFNQSGYAEAARNYILALHQLGVPVTVEAIRHNDQQPDLGRDGEVLASLVDRPIEYDRIILHDTPDTWAHRLRAEPPGIGTIGCTVWETSGLHPLWTKACNRVDEIWVPSRWNAEVFERSGVSRADRRDAPLHGGARRCRGGAAGDRGGAGRRLRLLLDLPLARA